MHILRDFSSDSAACISAAVALERIASIPGTCQDMPHVECADAAQQALQHGPLGCHAPCLQLQHHLLHSHSSLGLHLLDEGAPAVAEPVFGRAMCRHSAHAKGGVRQMGEQGGNGHGLGLTCRGGSAAWLSACMGDGHAPRGVVPDGMGCKVRTGAVLSFVSRPCSRAWHLSEPRS